MGGALRRPQGGGHRCGGCGTPLARDNTARLCGPCSRDQRDQLRTPPTRLQEDFFDTDEFRAAFESEDIGRVFKAYRNHPYHIKKYGKSINQGMLARWLGVSQGLVSKLEGGKKEEYIPTLREYARKLHLPQHLLWFKSEVGEKWVVAPNGILVATTSLFSPGELARLRERPRSVGQDALHSLAHVLHESRLIEDRIGAAPLLEPMRGHLTLVEGLVTDARGSLRQQVVSLGGQYAQFAAWVHASAGNATIARQYYDRAAEWALEVDDANMVSTALSMKGHLAYRLRQLGPMLGLSRAAQRDKRLAPGIRALAAQQEARALALNGELDPAERKLDEAMELAVRASEHPDNEPPWVYFYSPEYFTMQRGRAYLYLGLYEKAAELLEAGLTAMPQELRDAEWAQPYKTDLDTARKQLS